MTAKTYAVLSLLPGAILLPWALTHVSTAHLLPMMSMGTAYLLLVVQSAPLSGGVYLNTASPIGLAVVALLPPAPALLVPLLGVAVASRRVGRSWLDTASNLSAYAAAYAVAAGFYLKVAEPGASPLESPRSATALVGAFLINEIINVLIVAPRVALLTGRPILPTVRNSLVHGQSWGHHSLNLMGFFLVDGQQRHVIGALPVAVAFLTGVNGSIRFFLEREGLKRAAAYDALTGAFNRGEWHQACVKRAAEPALVMLVDVDGLKRVNDTFGHLNGDLALRDLAATLMEAVGRRGSVYRYGGDEFVVRANQNARQVEYDVEAALLGFRQRWQEKACSASVGSAFVGTDAPTLLEALRLADEEMYAHRRLKRENA